ncbi:hypothetical protein [Pseudothermotoga thermarum]|uniref:Uncharacterized protein n=1 Tax=Pseudothermotoga thermarum DSM 5069 TaxID=688269 RepID=F7YYH4_9THEM|nr:hypothetical protein [Pseudothermotoga thermarum]AEH51001.1 hypothetical protein Theth_0917 [Pseudothermotoga thermarum DSM 5069]
MNEEKFNRFLDGEVDLSELDEDTQKAVISYTKALEVAKIRFNYQPSNMMREKLLKKIKSRKRLVFELLVAGATAFAIFNVLISSIPKKVTMPPIQKATVSEVFDYLSLIKLVNDGF